MYRLLAALLVLAAGSHAAAQGPADLDALLDRVGDYVSSYTREFIGVVAEETYRQEARSRGTDLRGFPTEARQTRTLKSDVLLVRAPAGDRWLQFRDVFDVDGRPVRDRDERLAKLFLQPSASAQQQIEDIKAASARFNIGTVNRNMNLPVLPLTIFDASNQPWFTFTVGRRRDAAVELEFTEHRTNTMVRGRANEPAPSRGKFIVEPATGRVLGTEFLAEAGTVKAEVIVTYAGEPALGGLLMPREMREKYETRDGSVVEGRASYAKYRRYTVTVGEKIK